jgi:hypothetical protein
MQIIAQTVTLDASRVVYGATTNALVLKPLRFATAVPHLPSIARLLKLHADSMTSSYRNLDSWETWGEYGWTLENDSLPNDEVFSIDYGDLASYSHHEQGLAASDMQHHYTGTPGDLAPAAAYIAPHTNAWGQKSESSMSSPATGSFNDATQLLLSFNHLPPRTVPPDTSGLQRQDPRSEGDLYTAPFIKGEGVERMGWCSFCSSWHKLKDSAYWYVGSLLQHPATSSSTKLLPFGQVSLALLSWRQLFHRQANDRPAKDSMEFAGQRLARALPTL